MPEPTTAPAEDLARLFHDTYERLAPEHGYETRQDSAVPWEDVPAANKSLMIAVAGHVLAALAGDPGDLRERMAAALRAAYNAYGTADRLPQLVSYGTLADAAMSVLPAHHAAALARIRELEADQAAADEEVARLMAHNDETCSVVAERDRALAELERLRADNRLMNERLSLGQEGWNELHREAERLRAELAAQIQRAETAEHEITRVEGFCRDQRQRADGLEAERDALKAAIEAARMRIRLHLSEMGNQEHVRKVVGQMYADDLRKILAALDVPESTDAVGECEFGTGCICHATPETTPDAPTGGED